MTHEPRQSLGTVLLVEDDLAIAETLREVLESAAYNVLHVENGADARAALEHTDIELIVMDLGLPDVDGLVLCAGLKAIRDVPIIICSASQETRERVLALKLGADDFIRKPFDIYEFEARVEALMRRVRSKKEVHTASPSVPSGDPPIRLGDLVVDRSRRSITLGGQSLQLTPTEYRLLVALASREDEILTREELALIVWGYQDVSAGRTIDVHIRRLRLKLGSASVPPPPIISVRGFGYKMSAEATPAELEAQLAQA